jgi:hypothetical protein
MPTAVGLTALYPLTGEEVFRVVGGIGTMDSR